MWVFYLATTHIKIKSLLRLLQTQGAKQILQAVKNKSYHIHYYNEPSVCKANLGDCIKKALKHYPPTKNIILSYNESL